MGPPPRHNNNKKMQKNKSFNSSTSSLNSQELNTEGDEANTKAKKKEPRVEDRLLDLAEKTRIEMNEARRRSRPTFKPEMKKTENYQIKDWDRYDR